MSTNNPDIAVALYDQHTQAENAVKALQRAGFDMKKISIIGKDYETEEHVIGFLNAGDRAKIFGKYGAFWGGLMGVLFGSALIFVPDLRPYLHSGPARGHAFQRPPRRSGGGWCQCAGWCSHVDWDSQGLRIAL